MKEIIAYPGNHKNKKAIYLSPICFDKDFDLQNFKFLDLNFNKFTCELKIIEIEKYLDQNLFSLVKYTFPQLHNFFPLIHWKRILYSQIFYSTSLIFKIESLFDEIINKENSLKIKVLDEKDIYPLKGHPLSIAHIDGFELFKITSLILKNKKYKSIKLLPFSVLSTHKIENHKQTNKFFFKESIFKILELVIQNIRIGYGINFTDAIFFKASLSSLKVEKKKHNSAPIKKSRSEIDWKIKIISDLIPNNLKIKINECQRNSKFKPTDYKGQIRLVQNKIWFDFDEIIQSNIGSKNGQIIIPSQHGGDLYYNNDFFKKNTERSYDYFISWKKNIPNGEVNVLSLPSPLLSKLFNSYKKQNEKVILVGTQAFKFNIGFDGWFVNAKENFNYRNHKLKLIKFLSKKENNNFYYRPYETSSKNALKDCEFFKYKFENLNPIKSNLHDEIKNCKLLILDHPGTTLSIAFSINSPFLIYINKLNYFGLDKNSPMIKDLINHKILLTNLNEFKNHYNDIIEDPKKWWNSKEIQNLRTTFLETYALCDNNWRRSWILKLKKL